MPSLPWVQDWFLPEGVFFSAPKLIQIRLLVSVSLFWFLSCGKLLVFLFAANLASHRVPLLRECDGPAAASHSCPLFLHQPLRIQDEVHHRG